MRRPCLHRVLFVKAHGFENVVPELLDCLFFGKVRENLFRPSGVRNAHDTPFDAVGHAGVVELFVGGVRGPRNVADFFCVEAGIGGRILACDGNIAGFVVYDGFALHNCPLRNAREHFDRSVFEVDS